jgi:hypothetical protein
MESKATVNATSQGWNVTCSVDGQKSIFLTVPSSKVRELARFQINANFKAMWLATTESIFVKKELAKDVLLAPARGFSNRLYNLIGKPSPYLSSDSEFRRHRNWEAKDFIGRAKVNRDAAAIGFKLGIKAFFGSNDARKVLLEEKCYLSGVELKHASARYPQAEPEPQLSPSEHTERVAKIEFGQRIL